MQHNNAAAAHNAGSSRSRRRVRSNAAHNAAHNAAEAEAGAAPNAAAGNRSRSRSRGNVQGDVSLRSNGTHMTETERRSLEQRILLLASENRLQELFLEMERRLWDELSMHVQIYQTEIRRMQGEIRKCRERKLHHQTEIRRMQGDEMQNALQRRMQNADAELHHQNSCRLSLVVDRLLLVAGGSPAGTLQAPPGASRAGPPPATLSWRRR